jgi:hypothetical protein
VFGPDLRARQNFNFGFNKRFNFDGSFAPVPIAGDASASTVWSFGLTAFVQRRLREPQLSSSAVFVAPSASYVISKDWNASLAVEFLGRWFDPQQRRSFQAGLGGDSRLDRRLRVPGLHIRQRESSEHARPAGVGYPGFVSEGLVEFDWSRV